MYDLAQHIIDHAILGVDSAAGASGTAAANQLAFWTDASTISGSSRLTFDPATGIFQLGYDASNRFEISVAPGGRPTLQTYGSDDGGSPQFTFTSHTSFLQGISLGDPAGSSNIGWIDSQVQDISGNIQVLIQPTYSLSPGVDRTVFTVKDAALFRFIDCYPDGSLQFGRGTGSAVTGGFVNYANTSGNFYIGSNSKLTTGGDGASFTSSINGPGTWDKANFGVTNAATGIGGYSATSWAGGFSQAISGPASTTPPATTKNVWGHVAQAETGSGHSGKNITWTGGYLAVGLLGGKNKGIVSNWAGFYAPNAMQSALGSGSGLGNAYGFYAEEQTRGTGTNTGIQLNAATANYILAVLGDSSSTITWKSSGIVQFNGTTWNFASDVDVSAKNIKTDTSTGTQIATAIGQKLGFFAATPISQRANTVAIDTLIDAFGFRASGGLANFDTDVKVAVAGKGLYVKEGSNCTMGTGTLSGGAATISTTKVTANSRIFVTDQGGTVTNLGSLYEDNASRVAGTSFVVKSTNVLDASNFVWMIVEPA